MSKLSLGRGRCIIPLLALALVIVMGPPGALAQQPAPSSAVTPQTNAEIVFWQSIANSKSAGDYEAYLATYPNGVFSKLAKARLEDLKNAAQDTSAAKPSAEAPAQSLLGPSSSPGSRPPQYCCTQVGKLGPYANPGVNGVTVPVGGQCYGTTPAGPAFGTACN